MPAGRPPPSPNTMDSRVVGLPLPLLLVLPLRRSRWRRWPVAGSDARRWPADNHLLLLPLLPPAVTPLQEARKEEEEEEEEKDHATDTTASSTAVKMRRAGLFIVYSRLYSPFGGWDPFPPNHWGKNTI